MVTILAGFVLPGLLICDFNLYYSKKQPKRLMSDPENAGGDFYSKKNEP